MLAGCSWSVMRERGSYNGLLMMEIADEEHMDGTECY